MNVRGLAGVAAVAAVAVGLPSAVAGTRPSADPGRESDSPAGAALWAKRYNGPGNRDDRTYSSAASPDGSRLFVAGTSVGSGSNDDYATVAYDAASGARLWASRYSGPGDWYDWVSAVAVSPDGSRVFVTGGSVGSGSDFDYATVAYDAANGARLWLRRYNGPGNDSDRAMALTVSPDGSRLLVTGSSVGASGDYDFATIAYDAGSGAQLWLRRYDDPHNRDDLASALGLSPDGSRLFVTGQDALFGDYDYATVAYDAASGARLWVSSYDGPDHSGDWADALEVSPDGSRLFVTGQSAGVGGDDDYATVAYDAASGARLWASRYDGPDGTEDWPHALGASPDGSRLFVTGESRASASGDDYATVAYDAVSGARLWANRYNGPVNGQDYARALGVSPDGSRLFVTGGSWGVDGYPDVDYVTLAYDPATGARVWLRRYDGPIDGWDEAHALCVSPDGSRLFVTGGSWGTSGYFDYATVAYSTG